MNVKQYLRQLQGFEEKIAEQEEYVQDLRDSLTSVSVKMDGERVQSSPSGDGLANAVGKIVDAEAELQELKKKTALFRVQVLEQIHSMDDSVLKQVLLMKYVHWKDYKTMKDVAVKMGYSEDHMKRLHREALLQFGLKLATA